jgi:hypothetical protein
MTFSDVGRQKVNSTPVDTTIANIAQLLAPAKVGPRRTTAFQHHLWRLDAVIDRFRIGTDGEIALILYSIPSARYMNAYLANPACLTRHSRMRQQIIAARQELKNHAPQVTSTWQLLGFTVKLTGVGFWNPLHSTRGALANGAELRPVTRLKIESP